jgi:hypothetical protein
MRIRLDRQKLLRLLGGFPVQVPTEVGLLEFEAEQEPWQPLRRVPMTREIARVHDKIGMNSSNMEIWSNDTYEVFVKPADLEDDGTEGDREGLVHLSVKRYDRMAVHNWRHLQQMKNEILGDMREAIELYPGEHRIADTANQTHPWVLPAGVAVPLGFDGGFTLTPEQTEMMNANPASKSYQEPQQPGLTTGDKMRQAIEDGLADPEDQARFEQIIRDGKL